MIVRNQYINTRSRFPLIHSLGTYLPGMRPRAFAYRYMNARFQNVTRQRAGIDVNRPGDLRIEDIQVVGNDQHGIVSYGR